MKKQVIRLLCSTLSVLYYFDCVTSSSNDRVEVSLTLKSSPVPGEKSLRPMSSRLNLAQDSVLYSRQGRYKRGSFFHDFKRILPPKTDKPPVVPKPVMTINFTVVGGTVEIKFGPVQENMTYRVCLSQMPKDYECYNNAETKEGQDFVVFKQVEAGLYIVYVQRQDNPDNPMYASKMLNVTEIPSQHEEPTIAGSVVAIITLSCLLFVAGVTTLCFCLMRERCHCIPLNWKTCGCGLYHRTPHSVPNNIPGEEDDDSSLEILPLYYEESECFNSAVEKICLYMSKWSNCRINYDWMAWFSDDTDLSENHRNSIFIIFLSSKVWSLLSNPQQESDQKTRLIKRILMENDRKAFHKMIVSLHPLAETIKYLDGTKILRMTKPINGNNENRFEMNKEDLYTMLKQINGETGTVKRGWSSCEELGSLYNTIKYIPGKDLRIGEQLYVSKTNHSTNPETDKLPLETTEDVKVIKSAVNCADKFCQNMCSIRQKQEATYEWASSQQIGCCNPYSQIGHVPLSVYQQDGEQGNESLPHDVDMDFESASVCQELIYQRETIPSACHRCCPELHPISRHFDHPTENHQDWIPPEFDAESVSHSVIGQKQVEIYQNYKSTLGDTRL